LKLAIENGIDYFDLLFAHPELRDIISSVLSEMRESIFYAVHLGSVLSGGQYKKTRNCATASIYFHDFLKRFRTDRADVLFLNSRDGQEEYNRIFAQDGLYDLAHSLKEEGKARFLGFSGHTVATTLQVIQKSDIDVLMFPINLVSHRVEGKRELLLTCRLNKIGLVGMKPFAGGRLLSNNTIIQLEHFQSGGNHYVLEKNQPITAVQCLSYALAQVGVCTLVPGFESAEELTEAFEYFGVEE
jgi:predicted aldo/keto reductase-like oxidoreductase